jgi:hypothetical protein
MYFFAVILRYSCLPLTTEDRCSVATKAWTPDQHWLMPAAKRKPTFKEGRLIKKTAWRRVL